MKLTEWQISNNRIYGVVVGSDRYADDTLIETSTIVTAAFDGSDFLIRTANSTYECSADDYRGPEGELEDFIRKISGKQKQDTTKRIRPEKLRQN